jgi:hypothetical protein
MMPIRFQDGRSALHSRTSHNPPAPELLELYDRMGLLVMDESFEMWRIPKAANGCSKYFDEWSERDLRDMIRRDRNHPSIIMYSIGNEILEQGSADGWKEAKRLTDEDPFNYQPMRHEQIVNDHPNWVIYGSETESCVSSRGIYQSQWTKTTEGVLPHWNWQGHEGEAIPVMVYTNSDEVELFLNGQPLGARSGSPNQWSCQWELT